MKLHTLAAAFAATLVLAGCAGWGNKSTEYKGATARAAKPLEVPPELSAPTMDDRYSLPDARTQTTYSSYAQQNAAGTPAASNAAAGGPAAGVPQGGGGGGGDRERGVEGERGGVGGGRRSKKKK